MIKLENTVTPSAEQWLAVLYGCRNPMQSYDRMDSCVDYDDYLNPRGITIGENDMKLMRNLAKVGTDERKFMRMLPVIVDVTAPLYWWKEADQYKVGTVTNSCSTMHKIHAKEFTIDDFSHEHLTPAAKAMLSGVVERLNFARKEFLKGRKASDFGMPSAKEYWWDMIQLLPTSYNQRRTYCLNYEVLANIYFARRNHKLDEWRAFCDWILSLPYFKEIMEV